MHDRELGLGRQRVRVVADSREIAKTSLKALGDGYLRGGSPQDDLAGEVDPLSGQRVDNVVPRPRLGLIERFRRFGAASAGNHGDDVKIGDGASSHGAGAYT